MPMSPEEQAYYNTLMGDEATTKAKADYTKEPDIDFETYAAQVGAPVEDIKKELATEKKQPESSPNQPKEGGIVMPTDLTKGAVQGVAQVAQNVLNFGIDIADGIENFAADHGIGQGDLITGSSRINWADKLAKPTDSIATRATKKIVEYSAPALATMATGGGAMLGLGVGAAADLLMVDPKQERLSTILRDEVPELKNFPAAYKTLDYLANKSDETAIEGRFKNMIEGLGIAAPIAGVFTGIAKAGRMLSRSGTAVESLGKAGASAEEIVGASAKMPASEADLVAAEAKMGKNATQTPVQGDLYDYAATRADSDGTVKFNLNNDNVVSFAHQYAQANPKSPTDTFRAVKPFAELDEEAKAIITNQGQLEKLLSWKLGDRPLTDAETKASQYLMSNVYGNVVDAAKKAAESSNPDDLLHLSNMLDTFHYVDNARTGAGSEAGRALNAHKLGADLQEVSVDDFNKMLTDQGRQRLVEDTLKAAGGKDNLQELAKQIKALSEIPDADIPAALSLGSKSGFKKSMEIIQSVAINGMLSSPKTAMSNFISNAITTTNSVMTNYLAAGIGTVRGTTDGVRLKDANSYIRGIMGSMFEGLTAAGTALKTGKGGPANAIKGDLAVPIDAISASALEIPVEKNLAYNMIGKVVDGTGLAVGLPSRINATADAFWGTIMYRGKVYEEAVRMADNAGLKGKEAAAFINQRTKNVPVAMHENAKSFAQENIFSKALDPDSFAGKFDDVLNKIPAGNVVFPFFKTTANIVDYSVKHSPLSIFLGPTRDAVIRGGREGDIAIAKSLLGTSMLGAAAYMAADGMITGPDTRNPKMKQALEESGMGWQPDSFKIGDQYVGYNRVDPFSSYLRLGAVVSNLKNYLDAEEYQQLVSVAGTAVADFLTPEMMVDGYGRFFEAYNEAVKYDGNKEAVTKYMTDVAARFVPFSALQRDVKNLNDPYRGDASIAARDGGWLDKFTERVTNRYKQLSPWLSEELPIQRNIFGEPLLVPDGLGPDMISPFVTTKAGNTEVVQKLAQLTGFKEQMGPDDPNLLDMSLSMPSRTWTYKGVSLNLTPQEYERYVMYSAGLSPETTQPISGVSLREAMGQVLDSMKGLGTEMTPKQYNKIVGAISGIVLDYRKIGQSMMLQDSQIMDRWQKAVDAQNTPQEVDTFQ